MFSGIVETTAKIVTVTEGRQVLRLEIQRPIPFNDIKLGDSICVDGVCLTVEAIDECKMQFALAPETLGVTGWSIANLQGRIVNLERSLRLSDRIHGHLVTGHVDGRARVAQFDRLGESTALTVEIPEILGKYLWRKGSCTLNGVSLTINAVNGKNVEFGLIPETLKRTNLGSLAIDDTINVEVDWMARGMVHQIELRGQ